MPTQKIDHVSAVFGGEELRLRINRAHLLTTGPKFMCLDDSPFDQYRRLLEGKWTVADVTGPIQAGMVGAKGGLAFGYEKAVRDVLIKNGPVRYVTLAALLLEALLVGLNPDEAKFDEAAADG